MKYVNGKEMPEVESGPSDRVLHLRFCIVHEEAFVFVLYD